MTSTNKCIDCNIYYGNIKFNNKCSACAGLYNEYEHFPWRLDSFRKKIKKWVKKNTIEQNHPYYNVLKFNIKRNNLDQLILILKYMKEKNIYITANLAIYLLRDIGIDSNDKTHLICPFILDWWNINRSNNFNPAETCYYGIFNDSPENHIKSFPPKLPKKNI